MLFVVVIIGTIFWIWQFISLMNLPDKAFKGRHDKILWAVAMIALNLLGAITFFIWAFGKRTDELAGEDVQRVFESTAQRDS